MQKRSSNRDNAIQNGNKTYIGTACKICGLTEKYVSSYGCVSCSIKTNAHKLYDTELMKPYRTKEKTKKRAVIWRNKNPDKVQEQYQRKRLAKYNMTQEEFDIYLESQQGKCAICSNYLTNKFTVDHNHQTGKVRGLLCYKCNTGIGHLQDSVDILSEAIKYLKERN
jgi:hypothetical protein